MTSKEITHLYQFMMEEFKNLRLDLGTQMADGFAEVHGRIDRVYNILDTMRSTHDTLEVEQAAQQSQLNRHEKRLASHQKQLTLLTPRQNV